MESALRMYLTRLAIFSWGIWVVVVHAMIDAPCATPDTRWYSAPSHVATLLCGGWVGGWCSVGLTGAALAPAGR